MDNTMYSMLSQGVVESKKKSFFFVVQKLKRKIEKKTRVKNNFLNFIVHSEIV
jgi:hypothetical protein